MYFYVDESGHTGKNIFDPHQSIFYYGVLSSKVNLDILALPYIQNIKKKLNIKRLHAADLSNTRIASLVPDIQQIHKEYGLTFDAYKVVKRDHILICFFESVFDSNVNQAVSKEHYWTPVRYKLLLSLNSLFDEEVLKKVWTALIAENQKTAVVEFQNVCTIIKSRLNLVPDKEIQGIIREAIQWALDNPSKIRFNIHSGEGISEATPNLIGFQMVLEGMAERLRKVKSKPLKIIVDQQIQFNESQQDLTEIFLKISKHKLKRYGYGLPDFNLKGMPSLPLTFVSSEESAGLQLVDLFLWVYMRFSENKDLPGEVAPLLWHRGNKIELSLNSISRILKKCSEGEKNFTDEENEIKKMIEVQDKLKLGRL